MQFKHHFKHVDASESLEKYLEELMEKEGRFLLKDSTFNVYYSKSKHHHECEVEIQVHNGNGHFKAKASSDNFYRSVDLAASKLSKQFQKLKEKLQHHKDFLQSKEARLEHLNAKLEFEPIILPHKKTG